MPTSLLLIPWLLMTTPDAGVGALPLLTLSRAEVQARSSDDIAAAKASTVPAGVSFRLDGDLRSQGTTLAVEGFLENATPKAQQVTVFPVGADGFLLQPAAGRASRRPHPGPPLPPPVPPAPLIFTLPPMSRLAFRAAVDLAEWEWLPNTEPAMEWTFFFWNPPQPHGTLPIGKPQPHP